MHGNSRVLVLMGGTEKELLATRQQLIHSFPAHFSNENVEPNKSPISETDEYGKKSRGYHLALDITDRNNGEDGRWMDIYLPITHGSLTAVMSTERQITSQRPDADYAFVLLPPQPR